MISKVILASSTTDETEEDSMNHPTEPTSEKKQTAAARPNSLWAFYNDEGYHDSTAGAALAWIYREEMWLQQRKKRAEQTEKDGIPSKRGRHKECRRRKRDHDIQVVRYFDADGGKNT